MPRPIRPFTRAQARQNAAFLAELSLTGNAHAAARSLGVCRNTFTGRRKHHPAFAAQWDAALTLAQARLAADHGDAARPVPGEGRLVRTRSGRVQMRRQPRWRVSPDAQQAFLAALSATANVGLAAAAAGISTTTIYHRRRSDPGFAREMRLALEMGYERLEMALMESFAPESHEHDAWRHNDPPPIPPMSAAQALHLLTLHRRTVFNLDDPLRRRRGESSDVAQLRAVMMAEAMNERSRETFRVAEAARRSRAGLEPGEKPIILPALDQVTGWSKAEAEPVSPEEWTPFNGWRTPGRFEGL